MFFEGRELKSYYTPVAPEQLEVGKEYFDVSFIDEKMLIPLVESLIFIGRGLGDDPDYLYFQDAASYFDGIRYPDDVTENGGGYWRFSASALSLCEFEAALEQLLLCSLRRAEGS